MAATPSPSVAGKRTRNERRRAEVARRAKKMKRKVFGESKPWKREKEATVASSSAVAVSGGLHGCRRECTAKEKRERSREGESEAEGVWYL